jgi:hypothetical protein
MSLDLTFSILTLASCIVSISNIFLNIARGYLSLLLNIGVAMVIFKPLLITSPMIPIGSQEGCMPLAITLIGLVFLF